MPNSFTFSEANISIVVFILLLSVVVVVVGGSHVSVLYRCADTPLVLGLNNSVFCGPVICGCQVHSVRLLIGGSFGENFAENSEIKTNFVSFRGYIGP